MQIQHHLNTAAQQTERPIQMREGEVYRATIKEHRGKDEALVSIRGKEVVAKFEGGLPKGERATVQVIQSESEIIRVKLLNDEGRTLQQNANQSDNKREGRQQDVGQTLRHLGVQQPSPQLKKAAAIVMDKGVALTKDSIQDLQKFVNEGKPEQRLQTVQALANKHLDVTSTHLRSVHETLHGRPINDVLTDLAKELNRDFKVESVQRERMERPAVNSQTQAQSLREVRQDAQSALIVSRAADQVQQIANHPQVDRETSRTAERAVAEARHLDKISNERIHQSLQQVERATNNGVERQFISEVRKQLVQEGLTQSVREKFETLVRQNGESTSTAGDQLAKSYRQANQLQQAAIERLQQVTNLVEQKIQADQSLKEQSTEHSQTKTFGEAMKEADTALKQEASLYRAIQKIETVLSGQQSLSEDMQKMLNQTINSARELQLQGRELKARQELANAIREIDQINRRYSQNEEFQTSVEVASKSIAVTTVTEKMAQMAFDFKKTQRDLTRNLDLINRQIDQFRNQAQPQAKPLLETTIKILDNTILKSEMMLLTDMKTERKLMQASSQLAEAKKLLANGQYRQANDIVRDVKQQIDKMQFQPSETKVKHYTATNEQALQLQLPAKSFESKYVETVRGPIQEGSPRAMFEMVRNVGLNRDSEVAMQLASGREQQESSERNLKSILMQLSRGEEEGAKVQQMANQALSNLTGQQLLSRSDQQNNLQSLFFQLPILLENKVENLQVYVNSRNEGEKVDWENCSLYFLMETAKMGEIGIVVSAAERQLSVTLKNDKADFHDKMGPLVEMAVAKLSEIGYSIGGISYSKLNKVEDLTNKENQAAPQQPIFGEKGFDFKI